MKKLLGIVVLVLLWCNVGISGENKFTVQELNINLSNEYELQKIGISTSQYHGFPYFFSFYAQVKENKLISLLETFYIDVTVTSTEAVATPNVFLNWAKTILFEVDSDSGCNKSTTKQYFQVNNQKLGGIHCVSVKILSNKEIHSPNYNNVPRINMKPRTKILKQFIEENNLKVQDQMLRSEHFFWNKKKLVYVFLTDLTSDNITDEQIENFIINAVDMHKGFENDLKLKPEKKIDFSKFSTAEEGEAKAKAEAEATESGDIVEQLKKLKELYDDGVITKEQYKKAKHILLYKNN